MSFDRDVLDFAINSVNELQTRLTSLGVDNPRLAATSTLQALRQVRANDSLRSRYESIFNQALVLLVSYFSSVMDDLFRRGTEYAISRSEDSELLRQEVKVSVRELKELGGDFSRAIPELLIHTKDISFQDMQSIARAFRAYLDAGVERGEVTNDIIVGQACRHCIVHAGAIADGKLIKQVESASPRRVKTEIHLGDRVQFTPEEVEAVGEAMLSYINTLSKQISAKVGQEV